MAIFGKKKKPAEAKPEAAAEVGVEKVPASAKATVGKPAKAAAAEKKPASAKAAAPAKAAPKKDLRGKTDRADRVLGHPLVTEKATQLTVQNQYVFAVAPDANKVEIAKAVRAVYGVDPTQVRVANVVGKRVRRGRIQGKRKDWKKAIVTLAKGDKIELFERV